MIRFCLEVSIGDELTAAFIAELGFLPAKLYRT